MNPRKKPIKNILVVRNDKIGDFILCLPSLYLLRACYREAKIVVLVCDAVAPIARCLNHLIDGIIIDVGKKASKSEYRSLIQTIKSYNFDVSISLFANFHSAKCLYKANIADRFAPKTKLAQIFYNHKITQRRSQSIQAEYLYNLEVIHFFLKKFPGIKLASEIKLNTPYLHFDDKEVKQLKNEFLKKHKIESTKKLIFIHPGDGGSAANLSIEQYIDLANHLIGDSFHLVLSAGPTEIHLVQKLASGLKNKNYCILSEVNLITYAKHLQFADLLICGGTGPLHIAAALNRHTCGFFPRTPAASFIRWQPINDPEKQLCISPKENFASNAMDSIDVKEVAISVSKLFLML